MPLPEADFLQQLRAAFHIEAAEHLQAMSTDLLALEKGPAAEETRLLLERVFRDVHSLKGAARAVNFGAVETVCQALESVFALWKRRVVTGTAEDFDRVHQALDLVGQLIARDEPLDAPGDRAQVTAVVQQLSRIQNGPQRESVAAPRLVDTGSVKSRSTAEAELAEFAPRPQAATPAPRPTPAAAEHDAGGVPASPPAPGDEEPESGSGLVRTRIPIADTVRISTAKLDSLLLQAEELVALKLIGSQRVEELRQLLGTLDPWDKEWTKVAPDLRSWRQAAERPGVPRLSVDHKEALRLLEFLDWNHTWFRTFEHRLGTLVKAVEQDRRATSGMVDHLLADAKKLLMLPFSTLFLVLPKLIRDLCRDEGKQAGLVFRGSEVEIDKRVLEEMKDPLIHLVRNCVDHGIETPDQRVARHKPPTAELRITVAQIDSNKVEIVISDNGRGIDVANVRRAAVRQGVLTDEAAQQLDEAASLDLIFRSGVSTSPLLTELSGRGLGLAIVREKVERLGGQVFVETQVGAGTTFRVLLPLTLATFRGILVRAAEQVFVIPSAQLERVLRVRPSEIRTVENQPIIALDGRAVAVVPLAGALELAPPARPPQRQDFVLAVVLGSGEKRVAFSVDEVLQEQEVLIKSLGPPLARVRNVAGATVLGSGQPVVILHTGDLLKSASRVGLLPRHEPTVAEAPAREKSILLAEDSITARMLLKNILEGAGYHVRTAVDGLEAWTALKSEPFDALVSDIQMPRLNGFDLTARIRADQKLVDLPVILVTALSSREDRERGIDVGANAYIVKSSFDQGNLLEVVQRLA